MNIRTSRILRYGFYILIGINCALYVVNLIYQAMIVDSIKGINDIPIRYNNEVMAQEYRIETLYSRADRDLQDGIHYGDSLILNDKSLDRASIRGLHTIIGELLYDHDSTQLALDRFLLNESWNSVNIAGCYLKIGDVEKVEKAVLLLQQAAEINYDNRWYLGNLYEIACSFYDVKEVKEMAIEQYYTLYNMDTVIYSFCKTRIDELNQPDAQYLTELQFRNRRKRTVLLWR